MARSVQSDLDLHCPQKLLVSSLVKKELIVLRTRIARERSFVKWASVTKSVENENGVVSSYFLLVTDDIVIATGSIYLNDKSFDDSGKQPVACED